MNRRKPPVKSQQSKGQSAFRIIGGQWRGRKLAFPATEGLRPTPDRVRETVFNWLSGELHNADCLDLFCGSGALGLEALSRGARHCIFVDVEPLATSTIQSHLQVLPGASGETINARLPEGLSKLKQAADVVFLDPPYALDCIAECIDYLLEHQLLNPQAWVYVESPSNALAPVLPECLHQHRQKTAGQVRYTLLRYQPDG